MKGDFSNHRCPAGVSPRETTRGGEKPKRIQLSRKKGWRKPEGAVVVARPTKWGNPFAGARDYATRAAAVDRFAAGLDGRAHPESHMGIILSSIKELRGKDLCCWCPLDQPCHADVLLELANRDDPALSAHRLGDAPVGPRAPQGGTLA